MLPTPNKQQAARPIKAKTPTGASAKHRIDPTVETEANNQPF